jgi:hypothetical protein
MVILRARWFPCRDGRERLRLCPRGLYGAPSWDSNYPANGRHAGAATAEQHKENRAELTSIAAVPASMSRSPQLSVTIYRREMPASNMTTIGQQRRRMKLGDQTIYLHLARAHSIKSLSRR